MITKEKIDALLNKKAEQSNTIDLNAYANGLNDGVSFAEDELQNLAQEFAEWCGTEGWVQDGCADIWKCVLDHKISSFVRCTTSNLYAKFEAERNAQ